MSGPIGPHHASVAPPTPEAPYWHDVNGRRLDFQDVAITHEGRADELRELHILGTAAVLRAGIAAHAAGDHADGRRLTTKAARLCKEPDGHFPAASASTDG
jgi:hypothetical protein